MAVGGGASRTRRGGRGVAARTQSRRHVAPLGLAAVRRSVRAGRLGPGCGPRPPRAACPRRASRLPPAVVGAAPFPAHPSARPGAVPLRARSRRASPGAAGAAVRTRFPLGSVRLDRGTDAPSRASQPLFARPARPCRCFWPLPVVTNPSEAIGSGHTKRLTLSGPKHCGRGFFT